MDALIALWGHGIAAVLFAALLLWRVLDPVRQPGQRLLLGAFAMTAAWAWLAAIEPGSGLARFAETFRNLFWVAMLYSLSTESEEPQRGLRLVYGAVAAVIGFQLMVTLFAVTSPSVALTQTSSLLRLTTAAGALVLVHNLYGQAAPASRSHIRYAMLGLAAMWFYDLNYYTVRYLRADAVTSLADWRGIAIALTAPFFALAAREEEGWRFRMSRAASFQSLSLFAICGYFLLMAIVASALGETSVDWGSGILIVMLAAMTVGLMVLLPSARARGWLKVKLAKHLFEHRYDYRIEWLRFAATLGRAGPDAPPLGKRVIKAFADIVESPGGLLLVGDGMAPPEIAAEWNWPGNPPSASKLAEALAMWRSIEASRRVIELDGLRGGWASEADRAVQVPAWLIGDEMAWTAVPLAHNDRLIGMVLLATPDYRRPLDWEDFDLLRTAGRQAASALAEALGQEALANAQRFEEFNRRFAFILHDIKNLVSQLGLLSRNAERHADNPDFRADMVATLKSSVTKMNDLLERLAPHAQARIKPSSAQPLGPILVAATAGRSASRDIRLEGSLEAWVEVDAAALEQALGHLIQNACDASDPGQPIVIGVAARGSMTDIAVTDCGTGMDSDFIRHRLYQPFASSKDNGFGIGAFEARSLVLAMGGAIEVDSRPGKGTTFTVTVPAAEQSAANLRNIA
ncbi:MAG: XrtA/PEP-CTERM system histidine kinase PrsK [Sphingomicrobium sp.]